MAKEIKKHSLKSNRTNHKIKFDKNKKKFQAFQRQSKRKHKTNSAAHRAQREELLSNNPYCVECDKNGFVRLATVFDHKDGDSFNEAEDNKQGLCHSCHSKKTAKFDGGFGNTKKS